MGAQLAAAQQERPWHATVVMFDATGWTAHAWRFRYRPDLGGVWTCEWPGSMPLDELIDVLAYLHTMSPRMRRVTWEDSYEYIHTTPHPQWCLDVCWDDQPATPEGRLAAALHAGPRWGSTWFFPDEVGCIACRHLEATMGGISWLCRCVWTERALAALRAEGEPAG